MYLLALILASFVFASPAAAFAETPFPGCPNPGGTLKVSYVTGQHGIPGDYSTYTGSDSVYILSENQVVQCFCAESGTSGIQTNW